MCFANDTFLSTLPDTDQGRLLINGLFKYDKAQHAVGAMLLALVFGALFDPLVAVACAMMAGLLWEVKDIFFADGFSWRDLVADAAGCALYLGLMWRYWL